MKITYEILREKLEAGKIQPYQLAYALEGAQKEIDTIVLPTLGTFDAEFIAKEQEKILQIEAQREQAILNRDVLLRLMVEYNVEPRKTKICSRCNQVVSELMSSERGSVCPNCY